MFSTPHHPPPEPSCSLPGSRPSDSHTGPHSFPSLKKGPHIVLLTCPRKALASGIWEDQRWEAGPNLGRSRHSGHGHQAECLPPSPAHRQAAESWAESSQQKQKSIRFLPGPWEQKPPVFTWVQGPFVAAPQQLRGKQGFMGQG